MNQKYIVTLTEAERNRLKELIRKGNTQGYRIKHAQILLKLDEIPENQSWTYQRIKEAFSVMPHTISQIAKRFVSKGLEAALGRKEQANRRRKVDGNVEAHIVAIACSAPPEGRERWTLQLIADELVRLQVVESLSDAAVLNILKKTNLNPGKRKNGAFLKPARNS
ncbi:helix-turn-helix domain-containing protein [Acetonema longum]|uniref:Transposase n=1 Tax=Acetonema longum DSM 6540 TaxID=1009370 RepID=F7NKN4_9FIRM|nr:helix-turn-helix domain-containing protein [Acetonema longum]EGO63411.1 transposase [Acetonema longum DSM 6540]